MPHSKSRLNSTPGLVPRRPASAASSGPLSAFALRVAVGTLIVVLILALSYLAWQGVRELLEGFAGVLFAIFLAALSHGVRKLTGLPHGWALAIVVLALFLVAAGLGWLLASRLTMEVVELTKKLPESLKAVRDYLATTPWGNYLLQQVPQAATSLTHPGTFVEVTGLVSGVAEFLVAVLVIFFVGLFGAAEPELYRQGLLLLIPRRRRPRVAQALDAVAFNLRWWLVGQVCLMVMIGSSTALGLWLIGVPLALALGLIAGLLEAIPYLGPWLSAIPACLIAFMIGPWQLLLTLLLFLGLHILEGYILAPLVQRRAVHLPPALTLMAQVLLGAMLGILGLFVAAPLTVAAVVFLKMLYIHDTLGETGILVAGGPRPDGAARSAEKPP
jgi:predicted PurR-regulated permease PerM